MIVRVSIPSFRSDCACSSACSITAPQNDHEYGTTIPTFTPGEYARVEAPIACPKPRGSRVAHTLGR